MYVCTNQSRILVTSCNTFWELSKEDFCALFFFWLVLLYKFLYIFAYKIYAFSVHVGTYLKQDEWGVSRL